MEKVMDFVMEKVVVEKKHEVQDLGEKMALWSLMRWISW